MTEIFCDCEYAKFNGELISIAMVIDRDDYLYMARPDCELRKLALGADESDGWHMDPWVAENVMPLLWSVPDDVLERAIVSPLSEMGQHISDFIYHRSEVPTIICDWPEDLIHVNRLLLTGPGRSVHMESRTNMVCVRHIDVYPTTLEGAIQHNAWWDALAIKECLTK